MKSTTKHHLPLDFQLAWYLLTSVSNTKIDSNKKEKINFSIIRLLLNNMMVNELEV